MIMVDAIKHVPTALGTTPAPVNLDTHKMAFMDVQVCMFHHTTCCNVIMMFHQILMSVLVTMVVVIRRAPTTLVATPAPVELDTHKMAFMDVQVCLLYFILCVCMCIGSNFTRIASGTIAIPINHSDTPILIEFSFFN